MDRHKGWNTDVNASLMVDFTNDSVLVGPKISQLPGFTVSRSSYEGIDLSPSPWQRLTLSGANRETDLCQFCYKQTNN